MAKKDNFDSYSDEAQKKARVSDWYDRIASSVEKCPFCDLKEKYLIAEKDGMVLTVNLFPYLDGHLMVIPRRHVEKLTEITEKEWQSMKSLLELGMKVVCEALGVGRTNILYREGAGSGTSLPHLHVHILPITDAFMQYKKTHFILKFQELEYTPFQVAEKLRMYVK